MRSVMPASDGASVMVPPFSVMSTLRCPEVPRMPDIGCDSVPSLSSAVLTSVGRVMWTSTPLPRMARPVNGMRAWRSTRSTSSLSACSRSLRTALVSTSSNRLDPPCRSRPSEMWRCAHCGQRAIVLSEKKFGTANRHTTSAVSKIAAAFHREKNNIDLRHSSLRPPRRPSGLLLQRCSCARSARLVVLYRLAFGPYVADHGTQVADPHAIGDFDLDVVVVHDLGDLADQAAVGHHGIAAAQRLDHFLMLLHFALLRPQDQKIHDHHDEDQRQEIYDHVVAAGAAAEAELRICGGNQHCSSGGRC